MDKLVNDINKKIIGVNKDIIFNFTYINDFFVIHIFNPKRIPIVVDKSNKLFFDNFSKIVFDITNNKGNGCFNYEHTDYNDPIYKYSLQEIVNQYINCEYNFILIDKNFKPISLLSIDYNTIFNVCSDFKKRRQGHMTLLFNHVLKLVKNNKLKIPIEYNSLGINIRYDNPNIHSLINYYEKFNFKKNEELSNDFYLKMVMNNITK